MKKLGKGITAITATAGLSVGLGGCNALVNTIGTCSPDHWGDDLSVSIQSGPNPTSDEHPASLGFGDGWEAEKSFFVEEMPDSPITDTTEIRVHMVNGQFDAQGTAGGFDNGKISETDFSAEVELFNPDTNEVEQILAGPEKFDLTQPGPHEFVYPAGESALKLTVTFDPSSEGEQFLDSGIGSSPPYGDFTLTCIKKPGE